jgi:hypothetical protein
MGIVKDCKRNPPNMGNVSSTERKILILHLSNAQTCISNHLKSVTLYTKPQNCIVCKTPACQRTYTTLKFQTINFRQYNFLTSHFSDIRYTQQII